MLTSSSKQGMYSVIPGDSVYSKNGAVQHTVTTGYGTDGRISSAGFTRGGASKNFGYEYHRGSTLVAQRTYTYDILGRPTARNTARNGQTVNDSFAHNSRSGHPCLWLLTWDPTQPIATRPLAIQINGTWFTYGWDLTKNICEVFGQNGYIRTAYTYTPFGKVSATGDITQPIQCSSEVWDGELGLVYYNWRYYNALNGRWISRDIVQNNNIYVYCNNSVNINIDQLGASSFKEKNYKYIMLTIYKESEQPIDISPKGKKIIYSAAEEIVEELLMEILDNARVKILPSIDIINKLQLHGHSYWYLVYAYKCKNKDYWILGQSQVRGNGTNTGRDLYFFGHMQRREDKKGRLKKSLLEIDIEQTKNEILVMMSGACKECE